MYLAKRHDYDNRMCVTTSQSELSESELAVASESNVQRPTAGNLDDFSIGNFYVVVSLENLYK